MINLKRAKEKFKEYTSNYDKNNEKILLKIEHSYNVEKTSLILARELKLEDEDVLLAGLIGLLHDIGRFEQMRRYNTYSDIKSIDHADLSVQILTENNFIREFIEDDIYDNIILKSIKNHNKYKIENGLNEKELLHAKIIRDADKIDIMKIQANEPFYKLYGKEDISNQVPSEEVYNEIMNRHSVNKKNQKNDIDAWVIMIAFIFDFNYKESLKWIKEDGYIDKIINKINYNNEIAKLRMKNINVLVNNYINENM